MKHSEAILLSPPSFTIVTKRRFIQTFFLLRMNENCILQMWIRSTKPRFLTNRKSNFDVLLPIVVADTLVLHCILSHLVISVMVRRRYCFAVVIINLSSVTDVAHSCALHLQSLNCFSFRWYVLINGDQCNFQYISYCPF